MQLAMVLPKTYRSHLFLALLCIAVSFIGFYLQQTGNVRLPLAFSSTDIANGEYWRIVSAHFTHSNIYHLLLNLLGLVLLWLLHGDYCERVNILYSAILLCLGTSLCVYYFSPHLQYYVGFSGVLHGLFAWGVVIDIQLRRKSGYLLLLGLILKITEEQLFSSNTMIENLIGLPVAVDAHLYGACIGIVLGIISSRKFKAK